MGKIHGISISCLMGVVKSPRLHGSTIHPCGSTTQVVSFFAVFSALAAASSAHCALLIRTPDRRLGQQWPNSHNCILNLVTKVLVSFYFGPKV